MSNGGQLHEVSVEIGKLTAQVTALNDSMAEMSKKVEDLTALKNRGAGVLIGVGMIASAIGSLITWILSHQS
jgi:prefoldin subunit 5